jgi:hypothetical protein
MHANGHAIKHRDFSIPSLYEYLKGLAKDIAGKDRKMDVALVVSTLVILGTVFLSFGNALQNYTITGPAPF